MKTVLDVRRQLKELCQRLGVGLGSSQDSGVLRSLLGGLFTNVAEHTGEGKYLTVSKSHSQYLTCIVNKSHSQYLTVAFHSHTLGQTNGWQPVDTE